MSKESSANPIFQDRPFWLKIGVDHEEAVETAKPESIPVSEELLTRFLRRKRKVVESRFDSIQNFKTTVHNSDEAKDIVFSIYAEALWMKHWEDGVEFKHIDGRPNEVLSDLDGDIDYEDVNDEFGIIWPTETRVRREKRDGKVVGTRPNETNPIVVKKSESGIKVRASSHTIGTATDELRDRDDIEEVKPESTSERVTGNVQSFLNSEETDFSIIGVKFNESELPERSRLQIKNGRSIYDDLQILSGRHIISTEGISAIQKIFLRDTRFGGKYRIKVIHGNEGFRFELEAPDKLPRERESFKTRFTNRTGIEFGVVYEYGAQNKRHLFNRTLSGDGEAYDRYYDDLDEELQEIVDELTDVTHRTLKLCLNSQCRRAIPANRERCNECGSGEFSETFEDTEILFNHSRFATLINREINRNTPDPANFDVSGWVTEKIEMNSRKIVRTDFHATEFVKRGSSTSTRHQVFFVPQGEDRRPRQIDNYLLKCVYVTYGDSSVDDYEGYGRISLYDLFTSDSSDDLIGKALHDAITGTRTRTFRKANEAHDEATKYLEILSREKAFQNHVIELEGIYDPNHDAYFEKHVFYLLKGLFSLTERWGRTSEKEADGLLVIPIPDERDDYAAKVDMKLSHQVDGYDFGTGEEDQASRYMSNQAEVNALRAKTGRNYPSAHILISQNFDQEDFPRRARGIQENINELDRGERPDLVFMEFDAIVELYQFAIDHHEELDNPDIKRRFREFVIEELTTYETEEIQQFVHFNRDSIEHIRDGLLSIIDQYDHEPAKPYSE